jgi:hypothetical protein
MLHFKREIRSQLANEELNIPFAEDRRIQLGIDIFAVVDSRGMMPCPGTWRWEQRGRQGHMRWRSTARDLPSSNYYLIPTALRHLMRIPTTNQFGLIERYYPDARAS